MNALMAPGVLTITARSATAIRALASSGSVTCARRLKATVHTGFRSGA